MFFRPIIRVISIITLIAFLPTQVAWGYEGRALSNSARKSRLRSQQPRQADGIGKEIVIAMAGGAIGAEASAAANENITKNIGAVNLDERLPAVVEWRVPEHKRLGNFELLPAAHELYLDLRGKYKGISGFRKVEARVSSELSRLCVLIAASRLEGLGATIIEFERYLHTELVDSSAESGKRMVGMVADIIVEIDGKERIVEVKGYKENSQKFGYLFRVRKKDNKKEPAAVVYRAIAQKKGYGDVIIASVKNSYYKQDAISINPIPTRPGFVSLLISPPFDLIEEVVKSKRWTEDSPSSHLVVSTRLKLTKLAAANATGGSIKENQFRTVIGVFLGVFGVVGAGILTNSHFAINTFSHNGWFLVLSFVGISSLVYTFFAAKEKDFNVFFGGLVLKFLFAISIPCSAIAIGVGLSSPVVLTWLGALLKGNITPLNMGITMSVVVILNLIFHAYKYFVFPELKLRLKSDLLSFAKFVSAIVLTFVIYYIAVITGLTNIFSGVQLDGAWKYIEQFYSPSSYGLGFAVFIAPLLFMSANTIVQLRDMRNSKKAVGIKVDYSKAFDFRRVFVLAGFFSVFGSIFFSRFMEFYSDIVPRTMEFYLTGPVTYEVAFLPPCFIVIIVLELIKDIFTRDIAEHPDWSVYANKKIKDMLLKSFGFENIFIRGLIIYTLAAIFILNSSFCGGLKLTIFNCVDFIWGIVVSLFLQKVNDNGVRVEPVDVDVPVQPLITSDAKQPSITADANGKDASAQAIGDISSQRTQAIAAAFGIADRMQTRQFEIAVNALGVHNAEVQRRATNFTSAVGVSAAAEGKDAPVNLEGKGESDRIIDELKAKIKRHVSGEDAVAEVKWLLGELIKNSNCADELFAKNMPLHMATIADFIRPLAAKKFGNKIPPELLIAGMLHDADRFFDGYYVRFKDIPMQGNSSYAHVKNVQHPRQAAELAESLLELLNVGPEIREKVAILISHHETGLSDETYEAELVECSRILCLADAISLFTPQLLINLYKQRVVDEKRPKYFYTEVYNRYNRAGEEGREIVDEFMEEHYNDYLSIEYGEKAYEVFKKVQQDFAEASATGRFFILPVSIENPANGTRDILEFL